MSITPVRIRKPMPLKGRRTSWPADSIGDDYSPNNLNVRFQFGEVRNAPGRGVLAGTDGDGPATFIGTFPLIDGQTIWPLKLSNTKLYRLGNTVPGSPDEWHLVPGTYGPNGTRRWGTAVGEDHFFFSRGLNAINQWDGIVAHGWDVITPLDGIVPEARYLEYFNNRLIVGFTREQSVVFANRLRWPRSGDYRKWDDTLGLGAGFLDVTDEKQESIQNIRGLGERLVIYTRHSIKEMIATGTSDPVHVVQTRVRGVGCGAPYTVASNGVTHFFLGFDRNVWSWDGNQVTPVGTPIWEELRSLVYPDRLDGYFGQVSLQRNEYWLVLGSDVFVFDYLRGSWSRDSIANLTALGEVNRLTSALLWNQAMKPWGGYPVAWSSLAGLSLTNLIGGLQDGSTSIIDDSIIYDYFAIGSIMDRFVETPDYYLTDSPSKMVTLQRVLLVYKYTAADPFEFSVSLDQGFSWRPFQVTPNPSGYSYVDVNLTGNVIRFRLRENSANGYFRWRSAEYEFIDAGEFSGTI